MFNILFINSSPHYGGTEKWAITCAALLQQRGHKIWFAYRHDNLEQQLAKKGLDAIRFPLFNDLDIFSVFKIRKFIVKQKIDIVIATKVREYWLGGCAAKLASVPFIIRLGITRRLKKSIKNRLVYSNFMKAMIVNTRAIKKVLLENTLIDMERIHVVYNGIDCPDLPPVREKKDNAFTIVSVGSLSERKNVKTIVKIFYKLQNKINLVPVRLWLVGDGPQKDKLQNYVTELGIDEKVRFWGHREDIPQILQQSDIMLILSKSEGFPNAAMEAMAAGVPVVLSAVDGVKEFVSHGKNAFIVDPADEKSIIQLLMHLIKDADKYNKIRTNAYHHMKTNYSLSRMVDETELVLRSVMNG